VLIGVTVVQRAEGGQLGVELRILLDVQHAHPALEAGGLGLGVDLGLGTRTWAGTA
jgi:hypothetical protein